MSKEEGNISLMCDNTDCDVYWLGYKGEYDVFVCRCVEMDKSYEIADWPESVVESIKSGELTERREGKDDEDTIKNIRIAECYGMKCRVKMGDGIHVHCESCYGHVLSYLRD